MKYNLLSLLLQKHSYFNTMLLMITDHRNSNPVLEISSVKHERVKANENRASFSREVQESRHGIRMRDVRGVSLDQGENMKSGLIP